MPQSTPLSPSDESVSSSGARLESDVAEGAGWIVAESTDAERGE